MSAFPAINPEILIRREHLGEVGKFGHANETGVGHAHRAVRVLSEQSQHIRPMIIHREFQSYDFALQELKDWLWTDPLGLKDEDRLGQNCFASPQGVF